MQQKSLFHGEIWYINGLIETNVTVTYTKWLTSTASVVGDLTIVCSSFSPHSCPSMHSPFEPIVTLNWPTIYYINKFLQLCLRYIPLFWRLCACVFFSWYFSKKKSL